MVDEVQRIYPLSLLAEARTMDEAALLARFGPCPIWFVDDKDEVVLRKVAGEIYELHHV